MKLKSRANRCGDAKGEVAACTGADTSTAGSAAQRNGAKLEAVGLERR